jgi:HD-GYP domain-containing protein (c-di-GMP phosphodiesterase class II)
MNSLKIKILGLATAIMIMAVALTGWHNLQTQRAMLSRLADQSSRVLGETIRNSIITSMANGQNAEVVNILEKIRKEPAIEAVRIFDEAGRILISADPAENGELVSSSDLHAYRTKTLSFTKTLENEREVHSTILTIFNSQSCFGCHDSQIDVLGVLNVQVSLGELVLLQKKGREATILSSVGMLVILILTISGFILFYVDAPIRKLMAAMDYLEQGDFDRAHTRVRSSAEMSLLSTKFNLMVDRLKGLMETAVRNERKIAISREKLAHHDEIQNMNVTLEERLQEIEYLNISLEERIEEIEEANYKIADLAGDLEDRNTNLTNAVSRLSALYKMGLAINSTMEHDKLFEMLLNKTIATLQTKVGYILLFDRERFSLSIGSSVGLPSDLDIELRIPLEEGGVSNWVINNRQPLLIRDIDASTTFNRDSRLGFTRETVICAPLIVKDEVIGTITMANKLDLAPFTGEDLELLSTIAAQASVAIKNARLYEEQQHTYLSTMQALVSAVEASDAYTRGHSERVTRFSLALARQMELPAGSCKRLEQAAVLHDIGKIGIDLALLHKEEDLSPDDIHLLHQHPLIGDRILEPIRFLQGVREIIVQHHERFDGQGYPQGIRGEDLLIESRILSVADTYDAMTSDRPYRKALTHLTALSEIEKNSASQFDPRVVEAFLLLNRLGGLTD